MVSSCAEFRTPLVLPRRSSHIFPDAFAPYRDHIPKEEQGNLIQAYYARLTSDDVEVRRAAAKEWTRWEMATSRLFPDPEYLDKAEDLDFAVAFARIECHYFINAIFVEEAYILNHVDAIQSIPTVIVQGRYDVVCPPRSAWELHQALPQSQLVMVADAGHSMGRSASPVNWSPPPMLFVEAHGLQGVGKQCAFKRRLDREE